MYEWEKAEIVLSLLMANKTFGAHAQIYCRISANTQATWHLE